MRAYRRPLRASRALPRHHRHGAAPVRGRRVPVLRGAVPRAGRRAAARAVRAAAAGRPRLVRPARPPGGVAGHARRVAGDLPRRRPGPPDADPAALRDGRLERAAPRPVRGQGVPAPGRGQPQRPGHRSHRWRVPAGGAAAARAVAGYRSADPAGPRAGVHHPRPAGRLGTWLVGRPGAPRGVGDPLRPPAHPGPGVPRRNLSRGHARRVSATAATVGRVRVATWNVTSVKQRVPRLLPWLDQRRPDVVCLQETKLADDAFTKLLSGELADRGYAVGLHGEVQWNGVAILSRVGLDDVVPGFAGEPGFPAPEARAVSATCGGIRVYSVYVPNGRVSGSEHYR